MLVTLVGQGLLLPRVIRALGLANAGRRERMPTRAEEDEARRQAIEAVIDRLDGMAAERGLTAKTSVARRVRHRASLKSDRDQP